MIPPLEHPANALLVRWLAPRGVRVPALLGEWEVQLYTLLASPDLTSRMLSLAGTSVYWAIHGFPAVIGPDGQVDVVAAGLSTLVVRTDEPPPDLLRTDAHPPYGWVALDAWDIGPAGSPEEAEARLVELVRAARLR